MSTTFLQLQSSVTRPVVSTGIITFEQNVVAPDNTNISYSALTGVFTINTPGIYYVSWQVSVSSASSAEINLTTSNGDVFRSTSTVIPDQVSGSAIMRVPAAGMTLSLMNASPQAIQLGNGNIVANIVIHSIETSDNGQMIGSGTGAVVNFNSGGVDVLNPLTYPILLQVLQLSLVQNDINKLIDTFTCFGLEQLFDITPGLLGIVGGGAIELVLLPVRLALTALSQAWNLIFNPEGDPTTNTGLFSIDSYIGHSNVGIVPAIAGGDIPILSLIAGPPYPQIIAKEGNITSFAAEINILAAIDITLFNTISGIISGVINAILQIAAAVATLIETLISYAGELIGLNITLPSDFADILNNLVFNLWKTNTPETNHHVHAILWKGNASDTNALGGNVTWEQVSDLDLGPIPWLELSFVDAFLSSLGDTIAAGTDLAAALVTLLGARGKENPSPTNNVFVDAKTSGLSHPISVGDYLMVQFTLIGEDNTTIIAGVLATDLMASVTISSAENSTPQ